MAQFCSASIFQPTFSFVFFFFLGGGGGGGGGGGALGRRVYSQFGVVGPRVVVVAHSPLQNPR